MPMSDPQASALAAPSSNPLAMSRADAARALGLSLRTVADLIASGDIRAVRHGSRVLVPHEALAAWLASRPSVASAK